MSGEIPKRQINPSRTEKLQRFEEEMHDFIGPDGAWTRLMDARGFLADILKDHMITPEWLEFEREAVVARQENKKIASSQAERYRQDVATHRRGLSAEDTYRLVVSAYGLKEEFPNGPEYIIETDFRKNPEDLPFEDRMRALVAGFDTPSQLAIAMRHQEESPGPTNHPLTGIVSATETKMQAIGRIANEAEQWVKTNMDAIHAANEFDLESIEMNLQNYRQAYGEVKTFIARANEVLSAPGRVVDEDDLHIG